MSHQGTIRRYTLILEKVRFGQYPSIQQIMIYLEDYGFDLSKRTVERDLRALRDEFGIEIAFDRYKAGYYIDTENSINLEAFIRFLEIVNTANLLTESLSDSKQSLEYISFDQHGTLKGIENLSLALKAIKEFRILRILHHSYGAKTARIFKIEPYMLKEYQNRWYIAAIVCGMNEQRTFAIDRLEHIEILNETFKPTQRTQVINSYNQVIGVIYSDDKIEDVEPSFTPFQGKYIKSLPWHPSQTILIDNEKEVRVRLRVIPNYELKQKILMQGADVKVIEPQWLREELIQDLKKALKRYGF